MKRVLPIGLLVTLVLVGAAVVFLLDHPAEKSPAGAAPEEPERPTGKLKDITIRNVTKESIAYTLRPYGAKSATPERTLAVGAIDHYPARGSVIITYKKYGRDVSYTLYAGKPYSFRYDSAEKIDIWIGSHGRADAEDLAPFVPTPPEVVAKMLEMAEVTKDDIVYDIGCGDGRIVIAAAKERGARGVGIDIDPERIAECKINAAEAGVEKLVRFRQADATKIDVSPATIVMIYLLPESNELLRPKFDKELRPGTRVVSHNYSIPGWEAKEVTSSIVAIAENDEHTVFLYRR